MVRTTERGVKKEEHTEQTWENSPREGSEEDQKQKGPVGCPGETNEPLQGETSVTWNRKPKKKDVRWVQQTGRNIRKASQPSLLTGEQTGVMEFAGEEREMENVVILHTFPANPQGS